METRQQKTVVRVKKGQQFVYDDGGEEVIYEKIDAVMEPNSCCNVIANAKNVQTQELVFVKIHTLVTLVS